MVKIRYACVLFYTQQVHNEFYLCMYHFLLSYKCTQAFGFNLIYVHILSGLNRINFKVSTRESLEWNIH